jgi:hypothetical protein
MALRGMNWDDAPGSFMEGGMSNKEDTHVSVPEELLVYVSANGDTWYLCEDPSGLPAVKHVANLRSGGHVTCSEIESFLLGGNGPEHQALRQLLKQDHLLTILIACDIHSKPTSGYDDLAEAIQSLGAWWHHLETVWIVRSGKTPSEIRDKLAFHIGADDQLLVVDITRSGTEWAGINEAGNSWLKGNINPAALMA